MNTRARARSSGCLAGLAVTLTLAACKGPDVISLGGELATGPERFLSPTGDDMNPGTRDSPWKTFAYALPKLAPGMTLRLLNGTYDPGTTGMLNVRCAEPMASSTVPGATPAKHGLPTTDGLITVRADTDRKAWLKGDGRVPPISIESCHNWAIEGFYATSADVDTQAPNPDTGGVAVLDGDDQNVALRRLLLTSPNRYFSKAHLIRIGDGSSHVTVEINELYDFHASAIEVWRSDFPLVAFNYINSRGFRDGPDPTQLTADGARGDFGVRLQETSNAFVENNIVEDANIGFAVVGRDEGVDSSTPIHLITANKLLGNVAYAPGAIGFVIDSQCASKNPCDMAHIVSGTYLENDVVYGGGTGIFDLGSVGTTVEHASIVDAARGVYLVKDMHNAAIQANPSVRDTLALGFQSVAFSGGGTNTTWSFDHCDASGGYNPMFYYEPDSVPNITNKVTVTPDLGSCLVYLPMNSVLRMGAATVGANIIYQYDELGQLTTKPLWGPPFFGCGATFPNVNDGTDGTKKCTGVLAQLNVNQPPTATSPGCPLPL